MSLPYVQIDEEFIRVRAVRVAARLKAPLHQAIGLGVSLIAFAVEATSDKTRPPDGIFPEEDAGAVIEAGMGWTGEPGAAIAAFCHAKVIEPHGNGLRVKGTERYARTWEKNNRRHLKPVTGTKPAPMLPVTGTKPAENRAGDGDGDGDGDGSFKNPPVASAPAGQLGLIDPESEEIPPHSKAKKPKAKRPAPPPNPRHAPMVARLRESFVALRGHDWDFQGGRDAVALTELLDMATDEEIDRRWRIALKASFPGCSYVWELRSKWSHFATDSPRAQKQADPRKGVFRAEDADYSRDEIDENGNVTNF